jgi:hypothetical protein
MVVGIFTLDADRISQGFHRLMEGIEGGIQNTIAFAKNMLDNVFDFAHNVIDGIFSFLSDKFPQARGLFEGLKVFIHGVLDTIQGYITGTIHAVSSSVEGLFGGIEQIARGAIDVVVGIFEGSGERVVDGLRGIVNGFITVVEGVLDGVIGGVVDFANGIIGGLSRLPGVDIPSITFHGVSLPRLAQGAVIPPNREFMAVLGDQQHGNNIETPESLMRQVVREEAGQMIADAIAAMLGGNGGNAPDVVLMVGRKELARETLRGVRELQDTGELGMSGLLFT